MRRLVILNLIVILALITSGVASAHRSTSTEVRLHPDSVEVGNSNDITVTVSDTQDGSGKYSPSGTVTFSSSVTGDVFTPGSCTLEHSQGNKKATCTTIVTPATAGLHTITASYSGSIEHSMSDETDILKVKKARTTTTINSDNPDPSIVNQPIIISYSVTSDAGTPTGNVYVEDGKGATCTGTVAAGSCTLTPTVVGEKTLKAKYPGDSNFRESHDEAQNQVNPVPELSTLILMSASIFGIALVSRKYRCK